VHHWCVPLFPIVIVCGDYMNSRCVPLPSRCSLLYREEKDVLVFEITIFFITIIFKWASSQNPFNTFLFTMCDFLFEAPISFYVLSLPCFSHYCYLSCVVLCTPMYSPLFFIIIACYMWLSHEYSMCWYSNSTSSHLHPTLFFCYNVWFFCSQPLFCLVTLSWLQFSLLSLFVALLHKEEKEDPMYTSSSFSSIFSLIFKWTNSTKPHPLMYFYFIFGNVIFYS